MSTNHKGDKGSHLRLENGSRVAVIGGGPAGSFFSYFLLTMAQRLGKNITIDIYEPRDFDKPGPVGCNSCGGIISEWLVQALAADGINLPIDVVERGIDSYVLHMDVGDVRIETPLHEKRIGAVHRGAGPRGIKEIRFRGFDSFLFEQVRNKGAHVVSGRVHEVEMREGHPHVKIKGGDFKAYDLMAVAMGKNNAALKMFESLNIGYKPPKATKTYISEIHLGRETISQCLGSSMHVFLLNLTRLEFAALIPKGDYATLCLIGEEVDRELVHSFLSSDEVRLCLPPGWEMPSNLCQCSPLICIKGAVNPFADRVVFVGDCGVTRLYKDGIGAAYRTAKAAAVTAIFQGIAAEDFRRHYAPLLRRITIDNGFGHFVFWITRVIQKASLLRRGVLRMVAHEQRHANGAQRMSTVLWDTFTGSAPYQEVFMRTLNPTFWARFIWEIVAGLLSFKGNRVHARASGKQEGLGKVFHQGDVIIRQGELGDCMFVIQEGQVEVVRAEGTVESRLAVQGEGDFFGEMALVESEIRSATVRAIGTTRILTIDKRTFNRRVREDPSLAYRILQKMSSRLRELDGTVADVKAADMDSCIDRVGPAPTSPSSGEVRDMNRIYQPGETIIHQGQTDDNMYFIEKGSVEILQNRDGREVKFASAGAGDVVGEMAILESGIRSATVRALTETRVLVLDKMSFMRLVHEDPSLSFRLMKAISRRIRNLNVQFSDNALLKHRTRSTPSGEELLTGKSCALN